MTKCPDCNSRLIRSATMCEPSIVLRCQPCNLFWIEGNDQRIQGGPGLLDTLRLMAAKTEEAKSVAEQIRDTSIDDPRWAVLSRGD